MTVTSLPTLSTAVVWRAAAAVVTGGVVLVAATVEARSKTDSFLPGSRPRTTMDPPKTRSESKKDPRAKAQGKTVYSAKHVRQLEALKEKKKKT